MSAVVFQIILPMPQDLPSLPTQRLCLDSGFGEDGQAAVDLGLEK